MKKYLLLIFIFCLQLLPAKAQWVTIPDANFANFLTQNYPSCMSGNQLDTTCSDILTENYLWINNSSLSDLSGIEYFVNLNVLYCANNQLTTLPTLSENLTYLDCSNNQISNLPFLSDSLSTLICNNNYLSGFPNLPNNLTVLKCNQNDLISIPSLPSSLLSLTCSSQGGLLTALPTLPSSLLYLDCSHNPFLTIPPLPSNLVKFHCSGINISNLPILPDSLKSLKCSVNQLTSLGVLPYSLKYLDCSFNQLTMLPNLPVSLNSLNIYSNQISVLPSLPNQMDTLNCGNNFLVSLPSLPANLIYLSCAENQITNLPALPSGLKTLACLENQLTSLPPIPSSLTKLFCSHNQITTIPIVPSTMERFEINNNNIVCLANLPLVYFSSWANISSNPLTCVPNQTNYSLVLPLCMDNDPTNNPNYCTGIANITGYVYKDLDTNCNYANTDWHTENIPVKVYDGQNNMLAMSYTINGAYSFTLLQPDTFVVKIDDNVLPFSMDCAQANNQSVALDSSNQTIQNINFPVVCDSAYDIKVNSVNSQGWVFPGQQHTLNSNITDNMSWYNLNCNSINYTGTVSINITGPVTFVAPLPNALTPTVNGNSFTYNITDFSSLTPTSFGLQFLTYTTAQAGDQICVNVEINSTQSDADSSNNTYDFCYQVVNSYDPNMKEVYPVNVLPGYDDWFTYTIHFQNTGNAPAFNIRLRDTLDANLDINTFEVRGYSHPAIISINGNILTVRFNNIMLPDSTTDYEGSIGYFQYRIKPLPNLPLGTQIENTAYIYFDYNAPIITNTTQNNFQLVTDVKSIYANQNNYVIYPNPSNGIYFFKDSRNVQSIEVFNMMGELILSQGNANQINLNGYSRGVYLVRINGNTLSRLVKE
jgi:uncharacterized repeat protein (TIGR01451 family)